MGKAKLNLSFKETGRLTLKMFNKLLGHYKDNWDLEMRLTQKNITYAEAYVRSQQEQEWL
jgi:hypothetical protein